MSEVTKEDLAAVEVELSNGIDALRKERDMWRGQAHDNHELLMAATKFKTFVHAYLDQHGVPHGDPDNQHQKEGCRIGARLDLLFAERDTLRFDRDVWRATYLRKVQEAEKLKARLANAEDLLRERRQLYERIDHDTDEKRKWREKVDAYFLEAQ